MNPSFTSHRWLRAAWLGGCLGLMSVLGQPPEPPVPPEDAPAVVHSSRSQQRIHELVAVGGDAHVPVGQVSDDVVVIRGHARVEGDVDGDVVIVLGKVTLTGTVRGDVTVVLGEADIQGEVEGDVTLVVTRARFQSGARVQGEMIAVGDPPRVDPEVVFRHGPRIVSLGPLAHYIDGAKEYLFQGVFLLRPFPPRLGWVWAFAGAFLLFHLALALAFRGPLLACMETLREQPARSFLVGLLACILVAPISLLLSFTMVATPLIWLGFFALCVFGRVAAYATAGRAVGHASGIGFLGQPVPALLAGSVLFYLSYMIPVVGFATYWLVLPWGIGAVLIRLFEALRRERRPSAGVGSAGAYGTLTPAGGLSSGIAGPATHAVSTTESPAPGQAGAAESTAMGTVPDTSESAPASPVPPVPPAPETPPPASAAAPPLVPFPPGDLGAAVRVAFWPRLAAALIDLIVVGFVNVLTFGEVRSFWFLLAAYHLGMWTWKGTTLGGAVLGLRLIRLDGRPLDWQTAAVRVLGSLVSLLALGLGFVWVAWDDQVQSWHDRIAGTTIVRADRRMSLV